MVCIAKGGVCWLKWGSFKTLRWDMVAKGSFCGLEVYLEFLTQDSYSHCYLFKCLENPFSFCTWAKERPNTDKLNGKIHGSVYLQSPQGHQDFIQIVLLPLFAWLQITITWWHLVIALPYRLKKNLWVGSSTALFYNSFYLVSYFSDAFYIFFFLDLKQFLGKCYFDRKGQWNES